MSIGPGNPEPVAVMKYWAADSITPVHDLSIPIPEHKPPPLAEDLHKRREQRRKQPDKNQKQPERKPDPDGHIDEYA